MKKQYRFTLKATGTFITEDDPQQEMRHIESYLVEKMEAGGFNVRDIDLNFPKQRKQRNELGYPN